MCILVIPPPCWHLVCFTCSHFCHFDLPSSTLSLSFWCTLNTVIITIFKFLTANSKSDTSGMVSTDWFIFFLMGCIFMSLCISTWVLNIMHFTFSVQFSHLAMADSLQPHGLQYARPPCPSPTPRDYSNSCPLSQWCHPTVSFSFVPFSCLQSFPASGSFQMSQFFTSSSQRIGASASASVFPMSIQDWLPLEWIVWISLLSKGLSRVFSNTTVQKHQSFRAQLSHPYMTTGKTIALTRQTFVGKVMCLLFNMLSRLVITFLPRSKCHLISWLPSPPAVILETKNIKSVTVSIVSASTYHEVMGLDAMILVFWLLSFKPTFSFSSFTLLSAGYLFVLIDAPDCILRSDCIILTIWTREWVLRLIC